MPWLSQVHAFTAPGGLRHVESDSRANQLIDDVSRWNFGAAHRLLNTPIKISVTGVLQRPV
jgi:hypothetical protein